MYSCIVCDKVCRSSELLIAHIQLHVSHNEPLICKVCGKSCNQKGHLIDHYFTHTDHKLFECPSCGQKYKSSAGLRYHKKHCAKQLAKVDAKKCGGQLPKTKKEIVRNGSTSAENVFCKSTVAGERYGEENHKEWHTTQKCFICQVCKRKFKHLSVFMKHKKQHGDRSCIKPQVAVKTKCNKQTTDKLSTSYCEMCQHQFSCPTSFKRHIKDYHEGVKRRRNRAQDNYSKQNVGDGIKGRNAGQHTCHICRKNYVNRYSLRLHIARLHTRRQYKCDVCGRTYGTPYDLKHHIYKSHRDLEHDFHIPEPTLIKRKFSCYVCGQMFTQTSHLKTHCHTQHNLYDVYKCEFCAITFECRLVYKHHLRDSHGVHIKRSRSNNYNKTPAKFTSNSALLGERKSGDRTQTNHKVSSKTEISKQGKQGGRGAKFLSKSSSKHSEKHDTTKVLVGTTCDICGATFCSQSALKTHRGIHFDLRPHECHFCGMTFRQSAHLSSHCRTVHKQEYPYKCSICDILFKRKLDLRAHQRTHDVSEDELDDFKKSSTASNEDTDFEGDQYTKIVNSGQTEYACDYCDASAKTFKSLSALRRHVTIVHIGNCGKPCISYEKIDAKSKCETLETVSAQKESLEKISREEIYKCDMCSVILHGPEALNAHEKGHTKDKKQSLGSFNSSSPVSTFTLPTPSMDQSFECKFCGEEFDSSLREAFDEHQLDHELAANEPMGMSYMCIECDKEFVMASDLIQHHSEAH